MNHVLLGVLGWWLFTIAADCHSEPLPAGGEEFSEMCVFTPSRDKCVPLNGFALLGVDKTLVIFLTEEPDTGEEISPVKKEPAPPMKF